MKNELRMYKGWVIEPKNRFGMWCAHNYSSGWGLLRADTLEGMKQLITRTIAKGK